MTLPTRSIVRRGCDDIIAAMVVTITANLRADGHTEAEIAEAMETVGFAPEPWVYFVQGVDGGRIKIGVAAHPRDRLAQLQSMSPVDLRILAITHGGYAREAELHKRFAESRAHGEWFEPTSDLLELIEEVGPPDEEDLHGCTTRFGREAAQLWPVAG